MPSSFSSVPSRSNAAMRTINDHIGSAVQSIVHHRQPTIDISLNNSHGPHGDWVTSYSTMDTIEGTVTITANHDTRFEDIDIAFVGMTQVYVDRLTTTPSMSGRTEANHRFLTLKQPIDDADLPHPRKLIAGQTYTFPFTFTVPAQLLPRSCPHTVSNDFVRESHLMLPPSMGDPDTAGYGGMLLDDMAPEMSKIIYGIKVRITQARDPEGQVSVLATKLRKVRVKPAYDEQPPINIDPSSGEYRLRQEKSIKKGLFKGRLGTLTAQSAQPKALMVPGARSTNNVGQITTRAKVLLRFDPADGTDTQPPPRLGSLVSKLKVSTFYASAARHSIPSRMNLGYDLSQGVYQETLSLSTLCIASAQWEKHSKAANPLPDQDALERRDSGISDCSTLSAADTSFHTGILTASKKYAGADFYTAVITVPITLPRTKAFVPTFHSCLISRMYSLSFDVSAHAPGVGGPSLHLKVPIQVCAEGSDTGNENARARHAEANVRREADDLLTPRSVAPPPSTRVNDLPPGYDSFGVSTRAQQRVSIVA